MGINSVVSAAAKRRCRSRSLPARAPVSRDRDRCVVRKIEPYHRKALSRPYSSLLAGGSLLLMMNLVVQFFQQIAQTPHLVLADH